MIQVMAEHFLTEEGRNYFPTWVQNTRQALQKFAGFISLNQLIDTQNDERCLLILNFENIDTLRGWSTSQTHQELIDMLKEQSIRSQKSQIFEVLQ